MNTMFERINAVQQRVLLLHEHANASPIHPELLTVALDNLSLVLEELRTAHDELVQQNQALADYRQQLETERQRYQDLFNLAPDGYLVSDAKGIIQAGNVAIAALLRLPQGALVGKPMVLFLPVKHRRAFYAMLAQLSRSPQTLPTKTWETKILPREGTVIDVAITVSISHEGSEARLCWLLRDITAKKRAEAKIHRQAFYDQLTGLPNRAFLDTYLPKVLAQADRQNTQVAVAFLDLDRFKVINDSLGHDVGDQLLHQVAQRLTHGLRDEDLLVRWGGDEFIVVIPRLTTLASVPHTCDRILGSLKPTFAIDDHQLHIGTSIGVALFPQDGDDPITLLRHADQALYQAKNQGRNTYRLYSGDPPRTGVEHPDKDYSF